MPEIERSRVVARDGVGTVLRCAGPRGGRGIILIHGILHCSLIWKHQFADPLFAGRRLAAYDIRGHGAADKPDDAAFYQPERFADELEAVIDASGIVKPILVGWSLGTRMAFNYLDKNGADAIGGLVIVGARPKQVPQPGDAGQSAIRRSCEADLETRLSARSDFVRACYATPPSREDWAEILACAMLVPPAVLSHFAGRPMDYDALLAALPVPIRVLHGARDPVCPLDEVARIPRINPRVEMTVYPELGHAPFFEDAPRFNRDLAAFAA